MFSIVSHLFSHKTKSFPFNGDAANSDLESFLLLNETDRWVALQKKPSSSHRRKFCLQAFLIYMLLSLSDQAIKKNSS